MVKMRHFFDRKIWFLSTTLIILAHIRIAVCSEPSYDEIMLGVEYGIQQQYDDALTIFHQMQKQFPDHPAGSFFAAAIIQSRMMDFETKKWEKQFYNEINRAIKIARKRLAKQGRDGQMRYYYGAALGYKAFQLGRDKKYLAAIKTAIPSIRELKKSIQLDSTFCDPYLGIGSYKYWRSNLTEKFSWLPFFPNQKSEGIAMLEHVYHCGLFSKWAALSNLAWISIEEKDYRSAIEYANEGVQHFPESRFFLWPLAEALFKAEHFDQALENYYHILASVKEESFNNHYNEILLNWKIAQCYYQLSRNEQAMEACQRVLDIVPFDEVKKRAEGKKRKAAKMLKELQSRQELSN